jgi:hypothetical protein
MAAKKSAAKAANKSATKTAKAPAEGRVVAATGSATRSGVGSRGADTEKAMIDAINRGADTEKAMIDAINRAAAQGITDPAKVRQMMADAREDVRVDYAKREARAAKDQ